MGDPVMVGAHMALLSQTLVNDSKIMRKTQGEKYLVQDYPRHLIITLFSIIITRI